jgi:hypothetical protein
VLSVLFLSPTRGPQAAKYGGRLLLHDENAAGSLVGTWTAVGADEIRTTKETYVDAMTRFATRELGHATAAGLVVSNAGGAGMLPRILWSWLF